MRHEHQLRAMSPLARPLRQMADARYGWQDEEAPDEEESENEPLLAPPVPPSSWPAATTTPAPSPVGGVSTEATNARWLGLLFAETLALLLLQIMLGWSSGSLSLIADAPHSAIDVVTYGLAYWAEHAKLRLKSGQAPVANWQCCRRNCSPKLLDAASAGLGLGALLVATAFVAREAVNRLRFPADKADSDKNSAEAVGTALLTFSVASTVGNVGVLIMFRRWKEAALPPPPPPPAWAELPGLAEAEEEDESMPAAVNRHSNRRNRRKMRQKRLCDMTPEGGPVNCQLSCCTPGEASKSGWPTLHELLHPGCGHQGFGGKHDHGASDHSYSLNTSSAMLHLISDVIRGFTIFAVALLMKCHVVSNTGRADAACALLVAALVVLGSGALLIEVLRSLRVWRSGEDDGI